MKRFIFVLILAGLFSALVAGNVLGQHINSDPYPCDMCFQYGLTQNSDTEPDDCGTHYRRKIDGAPFRFDVVCVQVSKRDWQRYLWACPVCPSRRIHVRHN